MKFEEWFDARPGRYAEDDLTAAKAAWEYRDAEVAELKQTIAQIEYWQKSGEILFSKPYGLGFSLGKWWGERPWYKPRTY